MSMAQWDAAVERAFGKADTATVATVVLQLRTYADWVWSHRNERAFPLDAGWTPNRAELRDWREDVARMEMRAAHSVADALEKSAYQKDIDRARDILSGNWTNALEGSGGEA